MLSKTSLTLLILLITGFNVFCSPNENFYNVEKFAAKGDGRNLNSKANIHIYYRGEITDRQPERQVPEQENIYPEPGMFGPAPAYGFFIRYVKNIQLNNVQISLLNADNRPPLRMDDVQGVYLNRVKATDFNTGKLTVFNQVTGLQTFHSLDLK